MKLAVRDQARDDLDGIYAWIAKDAPRIADSVVARILTSFQIIVRFPRIGRSGRAVGTFEWPVPRLPYAVVYRLDENKHTVFVEAVFHAARDR